MQRYGFLTSIFTVLGSLLLSTTPSSGGTSTDHFIDQIATLKLAGKITEDSERESRSTVKGRTLMDFMIYSAPQPLLGNCQKVVNKFIPQPRHLTS